MFKSHYLLPDFGAPKVLLPDSVELDVADVMVFEEASFAPADDNRRLREIRPTLLQCALPPEAVAQY